MQAAIALNRFGLGARPQDRPPSDPRGWLIDQLRAYDPSPPAIVEAALPENAFDMIAEIRAANRSNSPEQVRAARENLNAGGLLGAAMDARIAAATNSETPFAERLVHFWANHFAISAQGTTLNTIAGAYEFDAIRPNILGSFGEMLEAVEKHPAMLIYLNQNVSIGPNSARAERRPNAPRTGLNENLAREILELHTLGVRSGYSEEDLRELARALTGRVVIGSGAGNNAPGQAGEYGFVENIHEPGERTLLGRRFPEGGEEQAEAMLAFVASRPETARNIATKLARHFIADEPPAAAVSRVERAFLDSEGDLPTVYRALVSSPEAWREPLAKFKSPWDWTISAWRAVQPVLPARRARRMVEALGQPIWQPGSPAGFADMSDEWASSDALMRRLEFAPGIAGRKREAVEPATLGRTVMPEVVSEHSLDEIALADSQEQGLAMLLVSPEFLRR